MKEYETSHLVKQEDLNHHGTLFAARAAGWLVEAAFVAAGCACGTSEGIVCRNLHEMSFSRPVPKGRIVRFCSRVVYAGRSSFMVAVTAADALTGDIYIEGMITFVTIDGQTGGKKAHSICLDAPKDDRERRQRKQAEKIRAQEGRGDRP